MNPRRQWILVIVIILILDLLAIYFTAAGRVSSAARPFSVSEVYGKVLLGEEVFIRGKIVKVLGDYVSRKGYVYQQFVISDGSENIKIFCSTKYGRAEVEEGEEIVFEGEFKKYHGTYEIYGFCSQLQPFRYFTRSAVIPCSYRLFDFLLKIEDSLLSEFCAFKY